MEEHFFFDTAGIVNQSDSEQSDDEFSIKKHTEMTHAAAEEEACVWEDPEELEFDLVSNNRAKKLRMNEEETAIAQETYEKRLKSQYEKIHPRPQWASQAEQDPESRINSLNIMKNTIQFKPDIIGMSRLKDANYKSYSNCVIQALDFHPNSQVLLSAGLDKKLKIFRVDGKENENIQNFHFQDLPIYSAFFLNSGVEIVCTGRRNFFYSLDLSSGNVHKIRTLVNREEKSLENVSYSPCGRFIVFTGRNGSLIILCAKNKHIITTVRMNGSASSVQFSKDGQFMYSIGKDFSLHKWDTKTFKCIEILSDSNSFGATQLSLSPNGQDICIGSTSGIVNVYATDFNDSSMKSKTSFLNLTTAIDQIEYHPSSQILGFCSSALKNSFRFVHCASNRVYSNWPTFSTPLNYVSCFKFSPSGSHVALGNDKGKVLLYNIKDSS